LAATVGGDSNGDGDSKDSNDGDDDGFDDRTGSMDGVDLLGKIRRW